MGRGEVLEMGGGDGCPTRCMYLIPLTVHLEMVKMAKFSVVYILRH